MKCFASQANATPPWTTISPCSSTCQSSQEAHSAPASPSGTGPRSWEKARRFVARIEVSFQQTKSGHLTQETDLRYCVTSLKGDPEHLYETVYCARGQAENLIKLHKRVPAQRLTSAGRPCAPAARP